MASSQSREDLQATLAEIAGLLDRHRVLETFARRQATERRDLLQQIQHRQNLVELEQRCRRLHAADLASILDVLPPDDRVLVWTHAPLRLRAQALVEVSDAVRWGLAEAADPDDLARCLRQLEADDLAYLEGRVPSDTWQMVCRGLDLTDQAFVRESVSFPEGSVGHLMVRQVATVRYRTTVGEALAELRHQDELPLLTDRIFVIDERHVLRGVVPLTALIRAEPALTIPEIMVTDTPTFGPAEPAGDAVKAFERYELVSAPVVDDRGKLLGRLTIDTIMEFARAEAARASLKQAGLQGEEDLFASILDSARNRWPWLLINLVTAFIASRVIGLFEETIAGLVALATLMPIVASIGGNTGNQTVALVIRALALGQVRAGMFAQLLRKELTVSLLNGLMWGAVVGLFAVVIYRSLPLGLVLLAAVALNLMIAALVGVVVPIYLQRIGRDPAQGASVLLTFITDSMGFFLFLGLARLFLR